MKQVLEQMIRFRVWQLLKMFCQGFFLFSEGFASAILSYGSKKKTEERSFNVCTCSW
jgi:hypothetical protein